MKLNSELGYKPVTFSELTEDQSFGMDVRPVKLRRATTYSTKMCLCTGMLYDPNKNSEHKSKEKVFQRLKESRKASS